MLRCHVLFLGIFMLSFLKVVIIRLLSMWQASVLSVQDCTDMDAEQSLVLRSVAQHKQEDEASVST